MIRRFGLERILINDIRSINPIEPPAQHFRRETGHQRHAPIVDGRAKRPGTVKHAGVFDRELLDARRAVDARVIERAARSIGITGLRQQGGELGMQSLA